MTAPPCVTTPCRRCHAPHPSRIGNDGQRTYAGADGHAWLAPDVLTLEPLAMNQLPAGWSRILGGLLARCATCACVVDNRPDDIATHSEWHHAIERQDT